jgi:hypothetical protein
MSARFVLVCVAGLVGLAAGQKRFLSDEEIQALPDCDDRLFGTRDRSKVSDAAFEWYCPNAYPLTDVEAYSCWSGGCTTNLYKVGSIVMPMGNCGQLVSYDSYTRRVFECMPWEVDPVLSRWGSQPIVSPYTADVGYEDSTFVGREKTGMWHLRAQFASFRPVRQWFESTAKDQSARVSRCEKSADGISFSGVACWHDDGEVVALKPWYKFKVRYDGNREFCVLSSTMGSEASYRSEKLLYISKPSGMDRVFMRCKFVSDGTHQNLDGLSRRRLLSGDPEWQFKDIEFHDYQIETTETACADAVTGACIDNAFSFYAKECAWVRKAPRKEPVPLDRLLGAVAPVDRASFSSYAKDSHYVLNLDQRNIEAWVNNERWGGEARRLDISNTRLHFTAKAGFSCSGCGEPGQALAPDANADACGTPLKCVTCESWQRVDSPWRNSWSKCDSLPIRKCAACAAHHVRSALSDKICEPCPALRPMRRDAGDAARQAACMLCEHTQWFDASSPDGCLFFMSVVDGLSFTSTTRFDKAYVDQYKPVGSTRRPEAVPALHYRNLVSDGNSWNASTSAEMCPPSSFGVVDASVSSVLTRNVHGRRVQFRRWCGHAEILKADDALMQPLDCGSRRPSNATSLAELIAGGVGRYTLTKERRLVSNRMAEVKLTLNDGFSCFYELRREGRAEDCRFCAGTTYTQGCGPTYFADLDAPAVAGPGTCVLCEEQCSRQQFPGHFFAVTQFSCWSNGTERVRGSAGFGSLKLIAQAMSASMNYWYKPAACMPCAELSDARVPQIVTRCGNKAWFETWDPSVEAPDEMQVARPAVRFCCALDRNSNTGTICMPLLTDLKLALPTPLCEPNVPDLATSYANFCPPDWFLDRTAPGCAGVLTEWKNTCCKKCELCAGGGKIKTDKYETCSGGTDYDTQLAGCVTTCAEKNYEVNGMCVACESCA